MLYNKLFLMLAVFVVFSRPSFSQHPVAFKNEVRKKYQWGFQIESGVKSGKAHQIADYLYKPLLLQLELQKPIVKSRNNIWYIDYFIQPQFNVVKYREKIFTSKDLTLTSSWETGVNLGLVFYRSLYTTSWGNTAAFYFMAGTGPHFVSATPSRQSNGFIFSDNWRFGLRIPIIKSVTLDLRRGRRHISNANLNPPNGGINNKILGLGLRYHFF